MTYELAYFVAACLAFAIAILWTANLAWQRRRRGRCQQCGYALDPGLSLCPECGLHSRTAPTFARAYAEILKGRPFRWCALLCLSIVLFARAVAPREEGWFYFVPTAVLFVTTSPDHDRDTLRHVVLMRRLQSTLDDSKDLGVVNSWACLKWARGTLRSDKEVRGIWALYVVPESTPGFVDVVEEGLRHKSGSVRCETARLCGRKHSVAHEVADLLLLLVASDEDVVVRICAADPVAKARVRPDAAVGLFLALLRETENEHSRMDQEFRRALIRALGNYGESAQAAIEPILHYSRGDLITQHVAVEALGNIGIADDRVVERLQELAKVPTYSLRRRAVFALEQLTMGVEAKDDNR